MELAPEAIKVNYRKMEWERDLVSILSITDGPDEPKTMLAGEPTPVEDELLLPIEKTGPTSTIDDKDSEISKKISRSKEKDAPRLVLSSLGIIIRAKWILNSIDLAEIPAALVEEPNPHLRRLEMSHNYLSSVPRALGRNLFALATLLLPYNKLEVRI